MWSVEEGGCPRRGVSSMEGGGGGMVKYGWSSGWVGTEIKGGW